MNRKDRERLIIVGFILLLIILIAASRYIGKTVNPMYIAVGTIVVQQIYVIPRFHKLYMSLLNIEEGSINKFIPLVNEISILPPTISLFILILSIVIVLLVLLSFVNPTVIASILGEQFAFRYTFVFLLGAIVSYMVLCIIRGVGYNTIYRFINEEHNKAFQSTGRSILGWTFIMNYIMFYIPIIRVIAILLTTDRLNKLVILNDLESLNNGDTLEEVY